MTLLQNSRLGLPLGLFLTSSPCQPPAAHVCPALLERPGAVAARPAKRSPGPCHPPGEAVSSPLVPSSLALSPLSPALQGGHEPKPYTRALRACPCIESSGRKVFLGHFPGSSPQPPAVLRGLAPTTLLGREGLNRSSRIQSSTKVPVSLQT